MLEAVTRPAAFLFQTGIFEMGALMLNGCTYITIKKLAPGPYTTCFLVICVCVCVCVCDPEMFSPACSSLLLMAQNRVSFFLCFCHLTSSHNPILKGMLIKNAAKPKPDDLSHQICCVRVGTGWRTKGFLTRFFTRVTFSPSKGGTSKHR